MSDQPSNGPERVLQKVRAVKLMRNALILLDEVGESVAASHLQFAIDTLGSSQSTEPEG